jgi:hypothetical protein
MAQFCIESVAPDFKMPRTHADETWQTWAEPYIVESKRLVTVRRNVARFERLESLNVTAVVRKDGIRIDLADFELDVHWREGLSEYATRHEERTRAFVRSIIRQSGRRDLLDREDPAQQDFLEYLETGLLERDFSDVF